MCIRDRSFRVVNWIIICHLVSKRKDSHVSLTDKNYIEILLADEAQITMRVIRFSLYRYSLLFSYHRRVKEAESESCLINRSKSDSLSISNEKMIIHSIELYFYWRRVVIYDVISVEICSWSFRKNPCIVNLELRDCVIHSFCWTLDKEVLIIELHFSYLWIFH